ncbi:MAG: hypothetical protein IJ518_01305 [Clostridia bacterium]|nr:hypothetical protein [Clostridia bacterium]
MDDLNEKLTGLLTSPEGMAKLQSVMAALTGGEAPLLSAPAPSPSAPPPSTAETAGQGLGSSLPDIGTLTKLLPLLSGMGQENEDTRLLRALRPYLHGEREKRLDETMRLLQMLRLLPILQEQGVLGGSKHGG